MTDAHEDAKWLARAYNTLDGKPPTQDELVDALRETQADDSTKLMEVSYRAPAAAVEELAQAFLAEEGITDPTEAQLVDVYGRAARMLEGQG